MHTCILVCIHVLLPCYWGVFVNQSNFYGANIPGEAKLSGATAKSVFNSKIEETVP